MKWKKVFTGAGALAVCSVVAKLLSALYRIPLTNIVGAEGIGLYQMVFPLYSVLLAVSSGGLATAVSRLVAAKIAKGDNAGATAVLRASVASLITISAVLMAVLALLRDKIAAVQGNPLASLAYLGIAPSILFVAVISCFRGYFQGKGNMLPSGISQITEQVIKLAAGLVLAALLLPFGVQYAVLGAILGVSLSELTAMLFLLAAYYVQKYRRTRKLTVKLSASAAQIESAADVMLLNDITFPVSTPRQVVKSLYRVAIPITLGSLILPLTQVIDSAMVINVLVMSGMERTAATSLFGIVSGPISSLINMPLAITLPLSVALLPRIVACNESKACIITPTSKSIALALSLSLPCAAVFLLFPHQIVTILYGRRFTLDQLNTSAALLRIESLSVVYVSLVQVATAVMQGLDRAHRPVLNLLVGAVIKVPVTLALLPVLGIVGASLASVLCYSVICILDIIGLKRAIRQRVSPSYVLKPLLCAVIFAVAAQLLYMLFSLFLPEIYALFVALIIAAVSYGGALLLTGTISLRDLKSN